MLDCHTLNGAKTLYKDWEVTGDENESLLAVHSSHSGRITAFWSDEMSIIQELSLHFMEKNPSVPMVRIFRATGNASYHQCIREIVAKPVPSTCFTLWIREDVLVTGHKEVSSILCSQACLLSTSS
jgi:hypothetical protein